MLIKSSMETLELAFDRAEYCCKKLFKSEEGGRYNKWYCYGTEFGQDYAWFKVEHTDYSVRLSFEFMETGFVYVDGYFTNGSSYDKKTITSWKFDSESEDATADKVKEVLDRFFDEGINVLRGEEVMNSRRTIKSSADNLPSEVYYAVINGVKMCYSTDYDKVAKIVRELKNEVGGKVNGPYTETDPEEIAEVIDAGIIRNSRRPVKSDWKREAEFMNDRIRDDNLLYQVFKIEDEHFGGNFENPDNWDGTHIVYTIENGEITNTEIVDSFEDVIDDGNKYYLSANRDTGYRNTDYVLDRVALWQERNNRGITSSRRPIKSGLQDGEVIFRASTRGGKNTVEVIDTGDSIDRYAIKQDGSMDYADTIKGVLAKLLKQAGWKEDTFSKIDVDTSNIGRDYLQIVKMINDEFGFLYKSPKGSRERQFYFDIIRFIAQNIERGSDMAIEDMIWKAKDALRAKGINSSRRPVKSSFVVGKTMNDGSKLYYCEDNCFYDENNYARPSIKIFNSKQEAEKISKRSKSGFVQEL